MKKGRDAWMKWEKIRKMKLLGIRRRRCMRRLLVEFASWTVLLATLGLLNTGPSITITVFAIIMGFGHARGSTTSAHNGGCISRRGFGLLALQECDLEGVQLVLVLLSFVFSFLCFSLPLILALQKYTGRTINIPCRRVDRDPLCIRGVVLRCAQDGSSIGLISR